MTDKKPDKPEKVIATIRGRIRSGAPKGEDFDAVAEVAELRGRSSGSQLHTKLIPQANAGLDRAIERWQLSRTDSANRLIQIGAFVADQMAAGNEILVRTQDGELQLVHII